MTDERIREYCYQAQQHTEDSLPEIMKDLLAERDREVEEWAKRYVLDCDEPYSNSAVASAAGGLIGFAAGESHALDELLAFLKGEA